MAVTIAREHQEDVLLHEVHLTRGERLVLLAHGKRDDVFSNDGWTVEQRKSNVVSHKTGVTGGHCAVLNCGGLEEGPERP